MKHMVRNDKLKKELFGEDYPDLIFYSCQFDDGHFAEGSDFLRLGDDGMGIWLFPCYSCMQQMISYGIQHIRNLNYENRKIIYYRDYCLSTLDGYEFPKTDTEEYKDMLREIDRSIDEKKPARLLGIRIKKMVTVEK